MPVSKDYVISSPTPDVDVPDIDSWTYLKNGIQKTPNETAIINASNNTSLTFKEFYDKVELLARGLMVINYDRRYPITLYSENTIDCCLLSAAAWRLGGSVALINHLLSVGELSNNLNMTASEIIFCTEATLNNTLEAKKDSKLKHVVIATGSHKECLSFSTLMEDKSNVEVSTPEINARNDVALIMFSSGTTGLPKAVELTHRSIVAESCILSAKELELFSNNGGIIYQPFSHIYGFMLWYLLLARNIKVIVMNRFNLEKYIGLVTEYKTTELFFVPPIAVGFSKSDFHKRYDLSHVKTIFCAAAPLGKDVEEQILQMMDGKVVIRQLYALTESGAGGTATPSIYIYPDEPCPSGSTGLPMPRVQIKVIDLQSGAVVGPHTEGEILIKCDHMMKGYIGNKKATDDMINSDGWLHSGDIGYFDDNGYLFIMDRLKELIKYKGYQVAPAELEALLLTHPDVADSGVIGLPDADCGELPHAWLVRKPNASVTEDDIVSFVHGHVAPYKRLSGGVKFVDKIPKTASGKILRREIKRLSIQ